jgi:hypothetical protein
MDRTIIRILALLIGAGGVVVTVTKASVPGTDMSFWDSNLFIAKQSIIESVHAWVFAGVALIGVLLELISEVSNWPKEQRLRSTGFYIWIASGITASLVVLFCFLTGSANWLARRTWQPRVVTEMQEAYKDARFIVEHDGWRLDQIDGNAAVSDPEVHRNANYESARGTLSQVEMLLELPPDTADLPQRVARLDKYFGR